MAQFTCQADSTNPSKSYVQLKNVKLVDYTSEANNTSNAAANFIDGNGKTDWFTNFDDTYGDKHYTVEFDKVRYITSIIYTPSLYNGRLKEADIYTSLDGKTWTKS